MTQLWLAHFYKTASVLSICQYFYHKSDINGEKFGLSRAGFSFSKRHTSSVIFGAVKLCSYLDVFLAGNINFDFYFLI